MERMMDKQKPATLDECFEAAELLQAKATQLDAEDFAAFEKRLAEPPKVLPRLREIMRGDLQQVRDALATFLAPINDGEIRIDEFHSLESALATLDRLIAEHGWQPIETAPRDGETKALYGCYKDGKWYTQITARGRGVGGLHVNVPTGFRSYTGATHWMPLPQPPTKGDE